MDDEDSHDHVNAQDDLVFDDDDLTWADVARESEVEELRFDTRAKTRVSSSMLPTSKGNDITSNSIPMPSNRDRGVNQPDQVDETKYSQDSLHIIGGPLTRAKTKRM